MSDLRSYRCPWCGSESTLPPSALNCPACGTAVDVRLITDAAGWYQLPPLRDMARLQVGQTMCQVEGTYVPVADFNLARGEHVYFRHHLLLWKDSSVALSRLPLQGIWRRFLAGLPLVMAQASGPGRVAISQDNPGELIAVPLNAGQSVNVREGTFLVATGQIQYEWLSSDVWYRTYTGTHYPLGRFVDRFRAADRHGLLLLHGHGNVFVRQMDGSQTLFVKPRSLIYTEPGVQLALCIEHPRGFRNAWSRRYVWLKMSGTGRVAIQSAFTHWADPPNPVRRMSPNSNVLDW